MQAATQEERATDIFKPEFWVGREDDMQKLWAATPTAGQVQVPDFAKISAEVRFKSKPKLIIPNKLDKAELFAQDEDGFCPLDDVRTWKNWYIIREALQNVDNPDDNALTKAELLQIDASGKPFLHTAHNEARVFFDDVRTYLKEHGDAITREELKAAGLSDIISSFDNIFLGLKNIEVFANYAADPIADLDAHISDGQRTALSYFAMDGMTKKVMVLLEAGANPDTRDKDTNINSLAHAFVSGNAYVIHDIIKALEHQYQDDRLSLLDALTASRSGESYLLQHSVYGLGSEAGLEIIEDAIEKVIDPIWDMSIEEMRETEINGRTLLQIVTAAGRLDLLFSPERWEGNPRGMKEFSDTIRPNIEIQYQLSGKDGRPDFNALLSALNASAIKSMTGYDDGPGMQ